MKDMMVWVIHAPAGTIGLVAATITLLSSKGGVLHRKAGTYFTISMLIMLISGFIAALLKQSIADMFLSAVVLYTVFTAWLTAHHKNNETGFLEYVALAWIMVVAIAAVFISINLNQAGVSNIYLYVAGFAVFCALADMRNLYQEGLSGIQCDIRHVWRMGFSLIWAVLALTDKIVKILGSDVKELPKEQLLYIIAAPTLLLLMIFMYWIINILFFTRNKYSGYSD